MSIEEQIESGIRERKAWKRRWSDLGTLFELIPTWLDSETRRIEVDQLYEYAIRKGRTLSEVRALNDPYVIFNLYTRMKRMSDRDNMENPYTDIIRLFSTALEQDDLVDAVVIGLSRAGHPVVRGIERLDPQTTLNLLRRTVA